MGWGDQPPANLGASRLRIGSLMRHSTKGTLDPMKLEPLPDPWLDPDDISTVNGMFYSACARAGPTVMRRARGWGYPGATRERGGLVRLG